MMPRAFAVFFAATALVAGLAAGLWTATALRKSSTTTVHLAAVSIPTAESENGAGRCGVERWAVKTATDPDAGRIARRARLATIAALDALPVPAALASGSSSARQPEERVVYRLRASLIAFKAEADSDIHLAVVDPARPEATMIVEFPAPWCVSGSPLASKIDAARAAFVARYGAPTGRYQRISGTATITGVAFFDRIHGQLGVAPNGIELHPALAIKEASQ